MSNGIQYNLTRNTCRELHLLPGFDIVGVMDLRTCEIVGNVTLPDHLSYRQVVSLVRRRFGKNCGTKGIGIKEEYIDQAVFGWQTDSTD